MAAAIATAAAGARQSIDAVASAGAAQLEEKIKKEYGNEVFALLTALSTCVGKVSRELKISEMKYGLMLAFPLLHFAHDPLPPPATSSELMNDPDLAAQARHWAAFAAAAYGAKEPDVGKTASDLEKVAHKLKGLADVKFADLPAGGVQCPGHYVAVDSKRRAVVLGVRGTVNLSDALTDAVGNSEVIQEIPGVETHQAILASAREVLHRTRQKIGVALAENEGFGIVVTGHSLGAGTAILCALLLKADPSLQSDPKIRCFAYAPPPIISTVNNELVASVEINAFVNRYDIVPRASLHNSYMLGKEALAVDQLEMSLMERMAVIQNKQSTAEGEASASQAKNAQNIAAITSAVNAVREKERQEPHQDFRPHFIPGKVFWIDADSDPARVLLSDCKEFQALLLRARMASLDDHRVTCYMKGLESMPPPTVTFPGGPEQHACCCVLQ